MLLLYFISVFFMSSLCNEQMREASLCDRCMVRHAPCSSESVAPCWSESIAAHVCSLLNQYTCFDIKVPVSRSNPHRQRGGKPARVAAPTHRAYCTQ